MSSDTVHTVVMAKKQIFAKLTKEYYDHWEDRMSVMAQQIDELVEEPYHENVLIKMKHKKMYFLLRKCWGELADIRCHAPTADFTVMKSLLARSTGRSVSRVPDGQFGLRMAMMNAKRLYESEDENNKKLKGWAEMMDGWLTMYENGQCLLNSFEQGKIPTGNWEVELDFDFDYE